MRCRAGDIAYISKSAVRSNIGVFVEVLRPYSGASSPSWYVRPTRDLISVSGFTFPAGCEVGQFDDHMQPIRDQPGTDETLEWLAVPGRVVEEVS